MVKYNITILNPRRKKVQMKTNTKKINGCKVELGVEIDAEGIKSIVKDVERAFVREVRLPGFRPGKVPLEMIRKEFADGIEKEILRMMVQKNLADAVKAENLDEVAVSEIKDVKHDAEGGSFTAVIEVKPEFKLPSYKGLKIEKRDTAVTEEALQDQLGRLRAAYAKYEDAKEGETVADGDFVQIDYTGTVGGKPILEISPDAKVVASGTGFWTQVEEGRFLPEILDALKGMKTGETKEGVVAKFDKENAPDGLGGKKAEYTLTLKAFRRRILPTDAEFAERAKAESVEKLAATVREQMEKHAEAEEAARRENEAVDLLLKKADFDIPETQVSRAKDAMLRQYAERAQYSGISAEYFEKNREKIMKDAQEAAERQVRLWYILEGIAKAENLETNDDDLGKKAIDFVLANTK